MLINARKQLRSGFAGRRVHAHVEGCVGAKRETTIGLVQLVRRHAEVHQDAHDIVIALKERSSAWSTNTSDSSAKVALTTRARSGKRVLDGCELVERRGVSVDAENPQVRSCLKDQPR